MAKKNTKIEEKTICSLQSLSSKKRKEFLTASVIDVDGTELMAFTMHRARQSKKDIEVIVGSNDRISDLVSFLDTLPESGRSNFWLECDCLTEALEFVYDTDDKTMYVLYFVVGSSSKKPRVVEVALGKDQIKELANKLASRPLEDRRNLHAVIV